MDTATNLLLFPDREQEFQPTNKRGILPSQKIAELIEVGHIKAPTTILDGQIQPASIDLRLGSVAYRVRAGLLPGTTNTVESQLRQFGYEEVDLTKPALLERNCVYIAPVQEELALPERVSARGNPKSTIGRLDVFTRLMADYGDEFDRIRAGYVGKLFVEIVPQSFAIVVHEGIRIYQVRFVLGNPRPAVAAHERLDARSPLLFGEDDQREEAIIREGVRITLDLTGVADSGIVGYKAKKDSGPIDLDRIDFYDRNEFWEPLLKPQEPQMVIYPDEFYLLLSKERISVRPESAAELVPYDPQIGEFRVHYAGFFDPGFGYGVGDIRGTHAVLEVRAHGVPFLFTDGQQVGRLIYEELICTPGKIYGPAIGSSYQRQGLSLSKQFRRGK